MAKQAAQLLAGHGVSHEVCYSASPDEPTRLAREALAAGAAAVVGIGGDGLVSQVATELVGSGTPLGIIPAGRGNDFARGLGIPARYSGRLRHGRRRSGSGGLISDRPTDGTFSQWRSWALPPRSTAGPTL